MCYEHSRRPQRTYVAAAVNVLALERWYDVADKATWKNLADIKADFPATDYVGNQHYVFNIRGNKYRLIVVVKFTIAHIFIRFVGTHSEYDKIDASTI